MHVYIHLRCCKRLLQHACPYTASTATNNTHYYSYHRAARAPPLLLALLSCCCCASSLLPAVFLTLDLYASSMRTLCLSTLSSFSNWFCLRLRFFLLPVTNPPEPSPAKTRESSGSVSGSLPLLLLLALRLPLVACRFAAAADVASAVSLRWRLLLPLRPLLLLLISAQ
jgi:hypothetical protein